MDAPASIWPSVLDFVLRERVDSEWAKGVLATIPPSWLSVAIDVDPSVKKSLLLRSLDHDLERGSLRLGTLRTLELIEEIDRPNNIDYLMCLAYWAVAAHCTAQSKEGAEGAGNFNDLVDRLWRSRVGDLMQSDSKIGLLSANLCEWYECLVTATADSNTRNRVLQSITVEKTARKAKDLLGQYVREARRGMGPSFIHRVYEKTCKPEAEGLETGREAPAVPGPWKDGDDAGALSSFLSPENIDQTASLEDMQKSGDASTVNLSTAEVEGDPEEKTAPVLQKEAERSPKRWKNGSGLLSSSSDGASNVERGVDFSRSKKDVINDGFNDYRGGGSEGQKGWDYNSEIATPEKRLKRRKVTLVDLPKHKKIVRRTPRKWSADEEHTLVKAVKRFGKGEWKKILDAHRSVFDGRTEVDLKDKWRNMIKPKKPIQQRPDTSEV